MIQPLTPTYQQQIKSHFRNTDPVIYTVMAEMDFRDWIKPETDPDNYFLHLSKVIISQQLATKASAAIIDRFEQLFPKQIITPEHVLKHPDQALRDVGISRSKVNYIQNLAEKSRDGKIRYGKLTELPDEGVIEELTKVKGVGLWTAEMFMIFALGREDIFSHGDLGLKRALENLYGLSDEPSQSQADNITRKWRPYRSYGCCVLWESLDNR